MAENPHKGFTDAAYRVLTPDGKERHKLACTAWQEGHDSRNEEVLRLEKEVAEANRRLAELREKVQAETRPFFDHPIAGQPPTEWYEDHLFNEERLYEDLGKDDARTVLSIWSRFKAIVAAVEAERLSKALEEK